MLLAAITPCGRRVGRNGAWDGPSAATAVAGARVEEGAAEVRGTGVTPAAAACDRASEDDDVELLCERVKTGAETTAAVTVDVVVVPVVVLVVVVAVVVVAGGTTAIRLAFRGSAAVPDVAAGVAEIPAEAPLVVEDVISARPAGLLLLLVLLVGLVIGTVAAAVCAAVGLKPVRPVELFNAETESGCCC